MKSILLLSFSTLFISILLAVPEGNTEPLGYKVKQKKLSISLTTHHFVMSNGLNVVVVVDETIPTFEYYTFYRVGAVDEPAYQQGAIHFLEHLMFGTKTASPEKLAREILINGGNGLNAFTSHYYTYFKRRFPRNKLDFAAKLDADISFNARITTEQIEKEKSIILSERQENINNPFRTLLDSTFSIIFNKPGYSVIGKAEFIQGMNKSHIEKVYKTHFGLDRKLIVIVGNVDPKLAIETIAGHFRNSPKNFINQFFLNDSDKPKSKEEYKKQVLTLYSDRINFQQMIKVWHTPGMEHPSFSALNLLGIIFNTESNSLKAFLIESSQVNTFDIGLLDLKGFGLFTCLGKICDNILSSEVEHTIEQYFRRFQAADITETSLQAAKNKFKKDFYTILQNPSELALKIGNSFAHTGNPMAFAENAKRVSTISLSDLRKAAKKYLTEENAVTVIIKPIQKNKDIKWLLITMCGIGVILAARFYIKKGK